MTIATLLINLLNAECDGVYSVEHYGVSVEPWTAFRSITGVHLQQNFETFLVVGSDVSQSWIFLACHLYAVKRAADFGRRTSCRCSSSSEVRNLVRGGSKVAASHCKGLACGYDSVWNNTKAKARAKAHLQPSRDSSRPAADLPMQLTITVGGLPK